jgi:type IV pilus assembly protein PilB
MNHGEKVVMRILDKQRTVLPLQDLGFSPRNLERYRNRIKAPYGMILHVGPTGSGKSMTLYAALNEIKDPTINVQTAEDPIEYTLPGINQLQTHKEIGLTFARALRSFLRLDPDVILVGEIRDHETAEIAIEAALTGHLLLSTLHTNDAASTVTRFVEMGIEPYMVSSSLLLVCAQRLLRRLCKECKEPYEPDKDQRILVGAADGEPIRLFRPRGCDKCNHSGYRGRIGIHEVLIPDDDMRSLINTKGITAEKLKRIAVEQGGMTTLFWDAMEKVRQGYCSVPDALANVRQDEFDSRPAWMRGNG